MPIPRSLPQPRSTAVVPPPGPAWWGAVMGTGILSSLSELHGVRPAALSFLVIGWGLVIGLTVGFIVYGLTRRHWVALAFTQPMQLPLWGMVSMGLLAVGAATQRVVSAQFPAAADLAWQVDLTVWTIATLLGIFTGLGFLAAWPRRLSGQVTPIWGLSLVPPNVSATTGAQLLPHLPSELGQRIMLWTTLGCFVFSLIFGTAVFALAYVHMAVKQPLPLEISASTFIPLGMIGQSTAAVLSVAATTVGLLEPAVSRAAIALAHAMAIGLVALAVPVGLFAVWTTYRALWRRMPFSPGWWSLTFPVGTVSLGTYTLGLTQVSAALTLLLGVHWVFCAAASLYAVGSQATARSPRTA